MKPCTVLNYKSSKNLGPSARGFTLVELLIVVVVVAILASVTIVAFNGVQQRARNASIESGVNVYVKALQLYASDNGSFPTTSFVCLGANYPGDQCWTGPNGTRTRNVSPALDSALQQYISPKPTLTTNMLQVTKSPDYRLGAEYVFVSANSAQIIYYLEGAGQTCLDSTIGTTMLQATECIYNL